MDQTVFAVLGGDARYAMLASLLAREGLTVYAAGFDLQPGLVTGCALTSVHSAASLAQAVILPMPPTKDGETLNAPLSAFRTRFDDSLASALSDKPVFAGLSDCMRNVASRCAALDYLDYCKREDFQLRNAYVTAECALAVIIEALPSTLNSCRVLVLGFGRIGSALAPMLRLLGADVSVCARKETHFASIESSGMHAVSYDRLRSTISEYELIVNTVPAMVLDSSFIELLDPAAVIVDLASQPGGVDFAAAHRRELTAIQALALPGKFAPLSAAGIIKSTIFAILREA